MENYKLIRTVESLEKEVASLSRSLYDMRQNQAEMQNEVKKLKERVANDDCK